MTNTEFIELKTLKSEKKITHAFFTKDIASSTNQYVKKENIEQNIIDYNRKLITDKLYRKPEELIILKQIHSNKVYVIKDKSDLINNKELEYDAIVCTIPDIILGILTADCVPILIFDPVTKIIAAIHAGWRGAFAGIIRNTIDEMIRLGSNPSDIIAGIGPCIRQNSYEIDQIFYDNFINQDILNEKYFINSTQDKYYMFDLPNYVKNMLQKLGICKIEDCNCDTFTDLRFISYRRFMKNKLGYESNILSVISLNNNDI